MDLRVGVVCTSGQRGTVIASGRSDSYVVGGGGRVSWLENGREHSERVPEGRGWLMVALDGDHGDEGGEAALTAARHLAALPRLETPEEPLDALMNSVAALHTRMYWSRRADEVSAAGTSVAAAWVLDGTMYWVEVGTARTWVVRDDVAHRLSKSWPMNASQRLGAGSRGLGDDTAVHLRVGVNAGRVTLYEGDQVVVATDGFWTAVDEASTAALLRHVDDPQAAAVSSMERAVARGTRDEVTVLVASVSAVATRVNRPAEASEQEATRSPHEHARTAP